MEQLVVVLMSVTAAGVIIGLFTRRAASPKELEEWARAHSVELTDGNRAMAAYWVRLLITLRVVGGTAGLLLGPLFDAATGLRTNDRGGFIIWVILGWVAGTCWAERAMARPGERRGAASLAPRRLADYLPRALRVGPAVAAGLVVALAIVAALAPAASPPRPPGRSDAVLVVTAVGAVALALMAALGARAVVGRRQPVARPDVVAVDDAVRATVLHHLAGGVTSALLLVALGVLNELLGARSESNSVEGWAALALFFGAFVVWRWSVHRAWRVRRAGLGPATSVPAP